MSHQVALAFEDGVTRFIACDEHQTVADASYRARINIPLDCRDGACGTCKSFCESGEYDAGSYVEDAMTRSEAEAGYVLTCQTRPRSDLVLQIATTSSVAKTQAATYTGTVTGLERLSPTTVRLTIETPERDRLAFLPGQYVNIDVPGTDQARSYSFSNAPDDKALTFLVKLTPGGVMSEYLTERASEGDELTFTGPNGSFFLRDTERPVLLLAGGTGLAPILSILRRLREEGTDRAMHLVYGVSTDDDLVELPAIEELAAGMNNLTWDYCVTDPASTAPNKGYVMGLIRPEHLYEGDVAVYLCGPPAMVEAVRTHFADEGVQPTGFYCEKFALSGAGAAADQVVTDTAVESPEEPAGEVGTATVSDPTPTGAPTGDLGGEGRAVVGQVVLPGVDVAPLRERRTRGSRADETTLARALVGQQMSRPVGDGPVGSLEPGESRVEAADARDLVGQEMLPRRDHRSGAVRGPRPAFASPGRFHGKVVLVTGAAQGIGEHTARRVSAEGGAVVLADRAELVHALADELSGNGGDALGVTTDLETWEGAERVVADAVARFGRVDVAIHTVGGTIWAKPFEQYPPEQIQAEINRSLFPTLWSCRAVLPVMIGQGHGTIVNVSSVATRGLNRVPYAAAKGGVNAITSALAMEASAYGIRVVATAPGGTEAPPRRIPRGPAPESQQERDWYQTIVDQTVDSSLMKRYGTLDEQAAAITFLASDEASYITGTTLPVAGGDLG